MRFRWQEKSFGRCGIVAIPEEGDVRPLFDELWLDHPIDTPGPDRIAAAAALTFRHGIAAAFKVPSPVTRSTARAIEDLDPTGERRVNLVGPGVASARVGKAILVLSADDPAASVGNRRGRERKVALNVLRTDQYAGGLLSMDSLALATNAWLHRARSSSRLEGWLPYIAVAVLVADDLGAGAIEIPGEVMESDHGLSIQVRKLCNAIGLALLSDSVEDD